MNHASFIEGPRVKGEKPIFAITAGLRLDSVFIQVSFKTYRTKEFQDWLTTLFTRLTPECEAVRIAIMNKIGN